MNYYPHHIGDYVKDTAHLTMIEDGAYRRLIDLYYLHEQPLPSEKKKVYRLARATSNPERKAIDTILEEYFTLTPEGFRHSRCDEEIEAYQGKSEDEEAKRDNEKERQRRHRQRRKELFDALREYDVVPAWDTKITDLETLLSRHQQRPVTRDSDVPVTPNDTANPITNNQEPSLSGVTVTGHDRNEASDDHPYGNPKSGALLCKTLRMLGVQVTPQNPGFREWVDAGLTDDEATAAVEIARAAKPAPEPIPWAYLSKVLTSQRNAGKSSVPKKQAEEAPWEGAL